MKIIKILSLICFLTIGVFANNANWAAISGKVFDVNQNPVEGATVTLVPEGSTSKKYEATTNNEGYYYIEAGSWNYTITAFYSENGKTSYTKPQEIALALDKETTLNLQLTETSAIREEVDVKISVGATQTIDEVAKTVNIIDNQQLRDRADFSLIESLRVVPGFRIQQLGGFGRTANIKTRGLRNQDTAILIDGIRFRDAASITGDASAFLSDFTLTSVDRIEVLRGSGSSLYGTNAVGGTIDFQTPRPQAGFHGNVSGAFGGYGLKRFRANVSDGTSDGKFGFNIGGSRTVYSEGIDGQDDAKNTNFQSRIEYNPFAKTNLSGRFFVSDAFVRLNNSPDTIGVLPASNATIINAVPLSGGQLERYEAGLPVTNANGATFIPDANDPDNFQDSQFFVGQFAVTQIINSKVVLQGSYQGLRTSRKNTNGVLGLGFQPFGGDQSSVFTGTIQTANAHANISAFRHNQLTIGYEYEHEKYGNDGFTPTGAGNFFTRAFQSSNTAYVQDLLGFFKDKLQFAVGARAQFFDLKSPEFSLSNAPYTNLKLENPPAAYTFDGAASYFFQQTGTKIRAHVGNGYRVPSLYERFGTFYSSFGTPSFVALGDPNLRPERTIAFDGGVEQNIFDDRAKLTATYFYTKLLNTINFGNVVPAIGATVRPFGGYLNTKGGIARGAEFSGQVKVTRSTDVFASYTYTNSDQRAPQVTGSRNIETLGVPKHQFTLSATQRYKRAWVNFDYLAASSYLAPIFSNSTFNTYIYRFEGNRRGDLTGGYTFLLNEDKLNVRVFGTIENVFDDEYYENGFRTFGRNCRIGLSFGF